MSTLPSEPTPLRTREYQRMRAMVRILALRGRLTREDAEDSTSVCLIGMWKSYAAGQISYSDLLSNNALLYRCANNTVMNTRREHERRHAHEVTWTDYEVEGSVLPDPPDPHRSPEAQVLAEDGHRQVSTVVASLSEAQQDLFERYFLQGETVSEIAQASGRSANAISHTFQRLCQRLSVLLEQNGLSMEDFADYLWFRLRSAG